MGFELASEQTRKRRDVSDIHDRVSS
jgi:hypothetical protein